MVNGMKALMTSLASLLLLSVAGCAETINVPDDLPTIDWAVKFAFDGDEIVVAPGTYAATTGTVINPQGKAITIRSSGGPEVTFIEGEFQSRGLLCESGETSQTIIEGFTIQNCSAPWYDWNGNNQEDYWEYFGGGAWCRDGSSPTIRSCVFLNGVAEYGGGICCFDESGSENSPIIENCRFEGNTAGPGVGGAIYSNSGSPAIIGCEFVGNSASYGGGILNFGGSDAVITDCIFDTNIAQLDGGAMYNDSSMPTVSSCSFVNNRAEDDGGAVFNADPSSSQNIPVFIECSFTGNIAVDEGGAMHNFSVSPELTSCSMTSNSASQGGAIYSWNSSNPSIAATTICGNTSDQIFGNWTDEGANDISDSCGQDDCPDANDDGQVNVNDILLIIAAWNTDDPGADVDGDGWVGTDDILAVLAGWGLCK
ncbi:MAG: hypothetical protein CMJ39_01270 [Phycisphaerae bacterium]|nr:hypothetical protein [Phycisphaerae bacterium]